MATDMAGTERSELTRERILDAAENVLRRHGLAKTTVVDVARALDMSHANVYRHFESKAALLDALVERWLETISNPLTEIADRTGPATERIEEFLLTLIALKRRHVLADPELFETYQAAAEAARDVVDTHLARHRANLVRIISDGIDNGEFAVTDAAIAAAALLDAMRVFFHPHHIADAMGRRSDEEVERDARRVLHLLLAGLETGAI